MLKLIKTQLALLGLARSEPDPLALLTDFPAAVLWQV